MSKGGIAAGEGRAEIFQQELGASLRLLDISGRLVPAFWIARLVRRSVLINGLVGGAPHFGFSKGISERILSGRRDRLRRCPHPGIIESRRCGDPVVQGREEQRFLVRSCSRRPVGASGSSSS